MVPRQSVRVTSHRRVVPMVPRAMIPTPPASARRDPESIHTDGPDPKDPPEGSSSTRGPLPLPYFGLLSARQASHRPPGPRVRPYGRTGSEGSAWYRGVPPRPRGPWTQRTESSFLRRVSNNRARACLPFKMLSRVIITRRSVPAGSVAYWIPGTRWYPPVPRGSFGSGPSGRMGSGTRRGWYLRAHPGRPYGRTDSPRHRSRIRSWLTRGRSTRILAYNRQLTLLLIAHQ